MHGIIHSAIQKETGNNHGTKPLRYHDPQIIKLSGDRLCLFSEGAFYVSSGKIAERAGISASRVREDLARVGINAERKGRDPGELMRRLKNCLGINRGLSVALLGSRGIGSGVVESGTFKALGMRLVMKYSVTDPENPCKELAECLVANKVDIAIINDEILASKAVLQLLEQRDVKAVWNLTGCEMPREEDSEVCIRDTDLAGSLLSLSCRIARKTG